MFSLFLFWFPYTCWLLLAGQAQDTHHLHFTHPLCQLLEKSLLPVDLVRPTLISGWCLRPTFQGPGQNWIQSKRPTTPSVDEDVEQLEPSAASRGQMGLTTTENCWAASANALSTFILWPSSSTPNHLNRKECWCWPGGTCGNNCSCLTHYSLRLETT